MIIFLLLVFVPIGASAARYFLAGDGRGNWQTADRSGAGILPPPDTHPEALIRVFTARTARWRSIFAVHTWIVIKEQGAANYSRYDYTAWVRTPAGLGQRPETIVAVDGVEASRLIPKIRHVIDNYKLRAYSDYSAWPGPNFIRSFKPCSMPYLYSKRSCRRSQLARTIHTKAIGLA